MYQAIYKCRLCGQAYAIEYDINGRMLFEEAKRTINNSSRFFNVLKVHECKNGSIGIADFQGFKKVGD